MYIIPEAGYNFRDEIRFTANGYYPIEKMVYLTVSDTRPVDNIRPEIWYTFRKACSILNNCIEEDWSIEVTAQDSQTGKKKSFKIVAIFEFIAFVGLRELTSFPEGLYFKNGYASGTKEPVTGYYKGSCCQSKLQIIAYDVMNNKKYYDIDAYSKYKKSKFSCRIIYLKT